MIKIELPKDVELIIDRFNRAGHRADIVGGSVRNTLLSLPAWDYDITTDALPEMTKEIFAGYKIVDTGIKHGTVTLIINGVPYEITTYREDGEYKDNRHPESVSFTNRLELDLSRRDFTVNAMCYNPTDGITDLFMGQADLDSKIIRAVGEPEVRFLEDALRILRAIRFASVLDFRVEAATRAAIFSQKELLLNVSRERIFVEWNKLVSGRGAYRILSEYRDVVNVFLPNLRIERLPDMESFECAEPMTRVLSLFMLNCADAASEYDRAMLSLRSDSKTRILGRTVLSLYPSFEPVSLSCMLVSLNKFGEDAVREALKLGRLLGRFTDAEDKVLSEALKSGRPYKLSGLALRGNDLIELGYSGTLVGEILAELLQRVMNGECDNERDSLITLAKSFAKK